MIPVSPADAIKSFQEEQPIPHAYLFNIIAYAHDKRHVDFLRGILQTVSEKFPSRIIFIDAYNPNEEHFFRVSCGIKGPANRTCDLMTIEAGGNELSRVPFVVLPNLAPDLPIYLLWGEDPTVENTILPHFINIASRLIFDSESATNLQRFSQTLLDRLKNLSLDAVDMNWAQTRGWRDVLAQMFNNPEKIMQLTNAKQIVIYFNKQPSDLVKHIETQAIFLHGWLAAQLEWKLQAKSLVNDTIILQYTNSYEGSTKIYLTPQENEGLSPGAISELEILAHDNTHYVLKRHPTLPQVVVYQSFLNECFLPYNFPLPPLRRGYTFLKEVFYRPTGNHYRNMLEVISNITW